MLQFESAWRFDTPGGIDRSVVNDFYDLIIKISRGEQWVLEHFKRYFASAAGITPSQSSNASWADSDLQNYMDYASENAPLFIEAFYDACIDLSGSEKNIPIPELDVLNRVLSKHKTSFQIIPPNLVQSTSTVSISVPEVPRSFDQKAQDIIQSSFRDSQKLLTEGRHRQAVQELLWLLETITTVFQGTRTGNNLIGGKYFNKIIEQLRRHNQGTSLEQIIGWIIKLHGYLSAPTGGGIRHGMHLKDGVATSPEEAKLYCNLIISYTSFLLSEYEKLKT